MTVIVPSMRVLAIDTALEACAAAVLDTETRQCVASESLPMVRGHAEALMPLIARVMGQAEMRLHELDRIAVTTGPGSFTGLRVGISAARGIALAAGKPAFGLTTLAAFAAPVHRRGRHDFRSRSRSMPAIEHVYLQVFGPGGRTLVAPRIASVARCGARRRQRPGAHRRHRPQACSRRPGPRASRRRCWSRSSRAPDIVWVGAARRRRDRESRHRPSRSICARPTRSRRTPRGCRADDRTWSPVCSRAASRCCRKRARATPPPSPRCTPPRSGAAGATAKSSGCCSNATWSRIAP